jgi:uncharacterized membrane protein YphA (DoxX/SURF4 family)
VTRTHEIHALSVLRWVLALVLAGQAGMLLFYEPAISAFDRAGLPSMIRLMLGSGEIVASMLFLIPATRRHGAWGLLAMIGGAILLHLAIGSYSVGNLLIDGAAITVVLVHDTVQAASRQQTLRENGSDD